MKKLLLSMLAAASLYAEASFDQIQSLIDKQQYKQAVLALNIIADNHPNSSKVQYTLAQAQAGLGNLPAAREALDKAIAINPKLDFVPVKQVEELSKTINTVQVIRKVEQESHWFLWSAGAIATLTAIWYFFFREPKSCTKPTVKPEQPAYTSRPYRSTSTYSRRPDDTSSPVMSTTSGYHPSYSRPNGKPSEVHHYYHDQSRGSDLGTTILASAATAAVVSSLMDDDSHNHRSDSTESYRPSYVTPEVLPSSSWNDSTPSIDTSWEDTSSTSSKSSSWDDSSSSSSSWSDSSSSSSDSWSSSSDSSSGGGD